MEKSSEEIIEDLYHEVGQMFLAGLSEDDIYKILYERDLVEKVALFIIKEAKKNIIKVSNTIQGKPDTDEKLQNLIEQIKNSKEYAVIDLRELEKFSSKDELLNNIDMPCIAFYDCERILTTDVVGDNKDIHNRQYAWKRKYTIEGNNVEHKAGMMQYLTKQEFDGFDYIDINMNDSEDNLVGKAIFPDGSTFLAKVSPHGKFLGSIEGNVNDITNN